MKKSILSFILITIVTFFTSTAVAQKFPALDKSPMDAATFPSSYRESDKIVKVIYSRPQLKGRSLEKLAPAEKVWRTGANEAAEITFYKDVTFGGKAVKAGTYSLFTIPGENEWTVIINKDINVWGSYMYKEGEDVIRVSAKVQKAPQKIEAFAIAFGGEEEAFNMHLAWGTVLVTVPIQ